MTLRCRIFGHRPSYEQLDTFGMVRKFAVECVRCGETDTFVTSYYDPSGSTGFSVRRVYPPKGIQGVRVYVVNGMQQMKVSKETWKRLNELKEPGDTFDDAVERLLDNSITLSEDQETALYYHLMDTLQDTDEWTQRELEGVLDKLPEYDILRRDKPVGAETAVAEGEFDADVIESETTENQHE